MSFRRADWGSITIKPFLEMLLFLGSLKILYVPHLRIRADE
jgi:hypothetical protein